MWSVQACDCECRKFLHFWAAAHLMLLSCKPESTSRELILAFVPLYRPMQAAKRRGIAFEVVEKKLTEIEVMLPGLVNLHRAKASDWVSIPRILKAPLITLHTRSPFANPYMWAMRFGTSWWTHVYHFKPWRVLPHKQSLAKQFWQQSSHTTKPWGSVSQTFYVALIQGHRKFLKMMLPHTQVAIILDMDLLATKIIILKDTFPSANVLKILSNQPRLLLQSAERLKSDAEQVWRCLHLQHFF